MVERCDERAVDQVEDLMGYVIALVLEIHQARMAALALQEGLAELGQRLADQCSLLTKQVEESLTSGQWNELH